MVTSPIAEPDQRLVVRGGRFALDIRGDGDPVLFIHGFPFNRTMWHLQLGQPAGARCIAPDLRGFGRSVPLSGRWTMADHADDLAGILDGLAIERAPVCGLSMGGYIAFELWRRHRNRIRALILANTRAEADSAEGRKLRDVTIDSVRQRG